jgi:hypothetical protein
MIKRKDEDEILRRAEQMLRESLAAQIKYGLLTPGMCFDQTELRRQLKDCRSAAIHAMRWERTHPGQQWMPAFTDTNRNEGLNEQRYRQYTPPVSSKI